MSNAKNARIGFIGAGWWATSNHMPVLAARDDVELVGVCRLGQNELQQVVDRFGFFDVGLHQMLQLGRDRAYRFLSEQDFFGISFLEFLHGKW